MKKPCLHTNIIGIPSLENRIKHHFYHFYMISKALEKSNIAEVLGHLCLQVAC